MKLVAVTCWHDYKENRSNIAEAYITSLEAVGLIPVVLPPSLSPAASAGALTGMAGLVLSGGDDLSPLVMGEEPEAFLGSVDPLRDEQELALITEARRLGLPILGICRGMQALNAALGGGIIQHLAQERPGAVQHTQKSPCWSRHHTIEIAPGTMLAEVFGTSKLGVNTIHHQGVGQIAPNFQASAWAADGVVEAIECSSPWMVGVQWHPEAMCGRYPEFLKLFKAFAAACGVAG